MIKRVQGALDAITRFFVIGILAGLMVLITFIVFGVLGVLSAFSEINKPPIFPGVPKNNNKPPVFPEEPNRRWR